MPGIGGDGGSGASNPTVTKTVLVSSSARLTITINQLNQNQAANTSQVQVIGTLHNDYTARVDSDGSVSREVTGVFSGIALGNFTFSIAAGAKFDFINVLFTVPHDADTGYRTAEFTIHYGDTGTNVFGKNKSANASLTLDRIPIAPSAPGHPIATNLTPSTADLAWTSPVDNGGSVVVNYKIHYLDTNTGHSAVANTNDNGIKLTLTDLIPAHTYTFFIVAENTSAAKTSGQSPDGAFTTPGGGYIRSGGTWKKAVPYVRTGGKWLLAVPYVRSGGVWKLLE
jgi:hypothetical protein